MTSREGIAELVGQIVDGKYRVKALLPAGRRESRWNRFSRISSGHRIKPQMV
jgi:hypothetical protein